MLLAVTLAVLVSGAGWAEVLPKVSLDSSGGTGAVIINGQPAVRFHAANGSLSPVQRAEITVGRIQRLVAQRVDPNSLFAKGDRYQGRVYAGETMICIATSGDARANRTTATGLAAAWAGNVRKLLLMPPIILSARELLVPFGETRRVQVSGAAAGPIYARVDDQEVATISVGADDRYVQVMGRQVGTTSTEIVVEGEHMRLPVTVRKYAGAVPAMLEAQVTGSPCPATFVSYAAKQSALQGVVAEAGARVQVETAQERSRPLWVGQSAAVKVDVKVDGKGYIPYSSQTLVNVTNLQMLRDSVNQLFYSNSPERLSKYQTLFAGKLALGESTRVLYHHQNVLGKRVHLIVEIINPSTAPAKFRVLKGVSTPAVDAVMVGHVAGNAFLRDYQNNVSVIEKVPGESRLILVSDMLAHQKTASGILQIRQMEGLPSYLRITAAQPWVDDVSVGTITAAPDPILLRLSDSIYPSPAKTLQADYVVGGQWAFIPIGKHALEDSAAEKKLYGNYGVTYDINVKVQNPTGERKKVSVLFEPSAGLASGVFIVDGKFVMAKYAEPPSEVPLASYDLEPGGVRNVRIMTVPLAGSNYPANLVVKS